jgi:hypothetical protein
MGFTFVDLPGSTMLEATLPDFEAGPEVQAS